MNRRAFGDLAAVGALATESGLFGGWVGAPPTRSNVLISFSLDDPRRGPEQFGDSRR